MLDLYTRVYAMNQYILDRKPEYEKRFPQVKNLVLSVSTASGKRLTATFVLHGQKCMVHFGLKGAYTYSDGAPPEKRDSYKARASKITNAKGEYTYMIPGTANSFAYWLLW
jgi:hypothetical protein